MTFRIAVANKNPMQRVDSYYVPRETREESAASVMSDALLFDRPGSSASTK